LEGLATMYCEIAFWGSCTLSFLLLQETEDANDLRIRGYVAREAASSGVWGNRKPRASFNVGARRELRKMLSSYRQTEKKSEGHR